MQCLEFFSHGAVDEEFCFALPNPLGGFGFEEFGNSVIVRCDHVSELLEFFAVEDTLCVAFQCFVDRVLQCNMHVFAPRGAGSEVLDKS